MRFNYQARTKDGQSQAGIVEASSREAALRVLQKYGVYVTVLEEAKAPIYARRIAIFERISKKDVVVFSRQLAIMTKSNVPLVESLHALVLQTSNRSLKEKIFRISEEVEGGTSLSKAFGLFPEIFSPFYINMVKSGESLGRLSDTLDYLADHLEREYRFSRKLLGAMIYPIFVLVVFVAVMAIMFIFVLPNLIETLESSNQELPLPTRIIIAVAFFARQWWWALALAIAGLIIFVPVFFRTETGRNLFGRVSLRTPVLRSFLKKIYLTRFSENLSTLIAGGLPIAQALEITSDVVSNIVYKEAILKVRDGVKKGDQISSVLMGYPELFPPLITQMTIVGEKTGQMDSSLKNIVKFYQQDVERAMENVTTLLEPIMVIFLGIMVAIILLAVIMPIYQSIQTAG